MRQDEASLSELILSMVLGCVETLRRNRLASILSAIALVGTTVLAVSSQYDERPRYRQVLLPEIARFEATFRDTMRAAEDTNNENWRASYFVAAHLKARETLQLIKGRWPHTREGIHAHAELLRYYELIVEDLAIIRTRSSLHQEMDYMAEWRKLQQERQPIHQVWENWVQAGPQ